MKTSPRLLLKVLVDCLAALEFPATYEGAESPFAGKKLFDVVKTFDLDDLGLAFQELLVFKKRVAIVVLNQERQTSQIMGRMLEVNFHEDFSVLISDQSYKNRQLALVGDDTTPGVLMLSDVLVQAMLGELSTGYVCVPHDGELFAITGKDRETQIGRIGWRQDLTLHGGRLTRSLSRQAMQTYAPGGA